MSKFWRWFWGIVIGGPIAAFVVWALADNTRLFFVTLLNGLTLASLYFIVAAGFTLVFGLMRNVNLAHGSLYLLGGYLGYVVAEYTGCGSSRWRWASPVRRLPGSRCRCRSSASCRGRTCGRRW